MEWIGGDNFEHYSVETLSLYDVMQTSFPSQVVDYLCIDTQGHEKSIICGSNPDFLKSRFAMIDVELMSDTEQYDVSSNDWREVVSHLICSGFEPIIHLKVTESYFINSNLRM